MTSLAPCGRTHPLGFHSKKSQLGLTVQDAEIGFLLQVAASALPSQSCGCGVCPSGEEHPLQGRIPLHRQRTGGCQAARATEGQTGRAMQEAAQDGKGLLGQQGKGLSSGEPQEGALTRTGACWGGGEGTGLELTITRRGV